MPVDSAARSDRPGMRAPLVPLPSSTKVACAARVRVRFFLRWGRRAMRRTARNRIADELHARPQRISTCLGIEDALTYTPTFSLTCWSTPSTSPWYCFSRSSFSASKRSTRTGCVFDARSRPQPCGKITRTPSTSTTLCVRLKRSATWDTTENLISSGHSMRISGVETVAGTPVSWADNGSS